VIYSRPDRHIPHRQAQSCHTIGVVLLGGLNPLALAVESGINVNSYTESGLIEFDKLTSFWDIT